MVKFGNRMAKLLEAARKSDRSSSIPRAWRDDVRGEIQGGGAARWSIAELYESLIPNGAELRNILRGAVGAGSDEHWERVGMQEAARVLESAMPYVSMSAFEYVTGELIFNHVREAWAASELIGEQLVENIPTSELQENMPSVGGVGNVGGPVKDGDDAPALGLAEDNVKSPPVLFFKLKVMLTAGVVAFDRTGKVMAEAAKCGNGLALGKENRILDVVTGLRNTYHYSGLQYNTYQTSGSWINDIATNPLVDWSSLNTSELAFSRLRDPLTGELIDVIPTQILVPRELRAYARQITSIVENRENTTGHSGSRTRINTDAGVGDYQVLSTNRLQDKTGNTTTWFCGNFKKAFGWREAKPLTTVPLTMAANEQSRGIVAGFLSEHWGEMVVLEPRQTQRNNAS